MLQKQTEQDQAMFEQMLIGTTLLALVRVPGPDEAGASC